MRYSIITIVLNSPNGLKNTLVSVNNQSFLDIEHLIIDGGSLDQTLEVANRLKKGHTKIYSQKDSGIYQAMNRGIKFSKGEWIIFMNAGDIFFNNKTLEKIDQFLKDPKAVYFGNTYLRKKNKILNPTKLDFRFSLPFNHQSVITPRNLFDNLKFDESFKILSDLKLYEKLFTMNVTFHKIELIIAEYDFDGISSIPSFQYLKELKRLKPASYNSFAFLFFRIKYLMKMIYGG